MIHVPDLRNYALAILAATTALFIYLYQGAVNDLATLKSSMALAQKQAEDVAKLRAEQEQRILEATARDWATVLDYMRTHPRIVRVQQPATCGGGEVPTVPAPSGEPDARPPEHGPDSIELTAEQCEARINAAVLDAAQVKHLQSWIIQQHAATSP